MKRLNIAVLAGLITLGAPLLAVAQKDEPKKVDKAVTSSSATSQAALQKEAKISMKKARSIALKKAPGKIASSELERENGKLIYSFDIKTGGAGVTEVNVDAMTGEVVSAKEETASQEAAEKKLEAKEKKTTTTKH